MLTALLVACGDDSSSGPEKPGFNTELSSEEDDSSSSSAGSKKSNSSSSAKKEVSSSSSLEEIDPPEEDLNVIYVLVNGAVSGVVALDEFSKGAQVEVVQLDSADGFVKSKNSFSGDVGKGGAYEVKKVNLSSPYVLLYADGKIESVVDGKSASVSLTALGDATSSIVFNCCWHLC